MWWEKNNILAFFFLFSFTLHAPQETPKSFSFSYSISAHASSNLYMERTHLENVPHLQFIVKKKTVSATEWTHYSLRGQAGRLCYKTLFTSKGVREILQSWKGTGSIKLISAHCIFLPSSHSPPLTSPLHSIYGVQLSSLHSSAAEDKGWELLVVEEVIEIIKFNINLFPGICWYFQ